MATVRYEVQMQDNVCGGWTPFIDGYTDRKEWAISRTKRARKLFPGYRIRCLEITERTIPVKDQK